MASKSKSESPASGSAAASIVSEPPLSTLHSPLATLFVALLVFVFYFFAARDIAPGWDEGYTWKRLDALEPWLKRWFQGAGVGDQLSAATLKNAWQFSREEPDGHGPFYALVSFAGHALTRNFLSQPLSYRVGSVTLFAFACAILFSALRRRWGSWPAGSAVALLATQPRIMPEICFGVVDGPLLSVTILAFCGFLAALERPTFWRIAAFGIPAGCAMATKLTGWVLLGPYLAFVVLQSVQSFRDESNVDSFMRLLKVVGWGFCIAAATCLILNVGWWPNPIDGAIRFFRSNLTRNETTHIPTFFMGRTYDFALPWYNTLVWSYVAMPFTTLLLGVVGLFVAIRDRRPEMVLAALVWLTIMVVRSLPQAPGHDGVRQIIVAFAFLSILAGGALPTIERWYYRWRVVFIGPLFAAASAMTCWNYHPLQLSYYSELVGKLPRASQYFEPTYFWDALTPDAVKFLNENTAPGRSILFATNPENWKYLYRWRTLKHPPYDGTLEPQWYVVQHRTGMLRPEDRWLIEREKPAYRVSKMGVSLVSVFSIEQYQRARTESR